MESHLSTEAVEQAGDKFGGSRQTRMAAGGALVCTRNEQGYPPGRKEGWGTGAGDLDQLSHSPGLGRSTSTTKALLALTREQLDQGQTFCGGAQWRLGQASSIGARRMKVRPCGSIRSLGSKTRGNRAIH